MSDHLRLRDLRLTPKALLHLYILALFVILILTLSPGVWVTDESTYLLMVDTFVDNLDFEIYNGFDELSSPELWLPGTQLVSNGEEVKMYGVPAPLYLIIAAPFYLALGVIGLNLMNVISYAACILVFYRLSSLLYGEGFALPASVLYSLTYTLGYSQMLWPHMLSVLIVLSSTYLLLRHHFGLASGTFAVFLSGMLSGIAIGIRYTNGMFTGLSLLFIWLFMRERIKPYLTGLMLPAVAIACLNLLFYGSVFETSYGPILHYIIIFTLGILGAGALIRKAKGAKIGRHLTARKALVVAAFTVLVMSLHPATLIYLKYFYSKVFDMSLMPGYPGVHKKAFLQSVPYLIMAVFAPRFLFKRWDKAPVPLLIICFALAEPLFFSVRESIGGQDETYGMRYFLESLPFLVLLACYSINSIIEKLTRTEAAYSIVTFLASTSFLLSSGHRLYSTGDLHHDMPLLLVLMLAILAVIYMAYGRLRLFLLLALVLSFSYASSIAYADLKVMKTTRDIVWDTSSQLSANVRDDSAIIFSSKNEYPYLVAPKLDKRVRLVAAYVDYGNDLPAIMEQYSRDGITIYISNWGGRDWYEATRDFILENNITEAYYLNYDTKNPLFEDKEKKKELE